MFHADGQTDKTKPIVALLSFANAPKSNSITCERSVLLCDVVQQLSLRESRSTAPVNRYLPFSTVNSHPPVQKYNKFVRRIKCSKALVFLYLNSHSNSVVSTRNWTHTYYNFTFRRRIKSRLPFAGVIKRLPYSTRSQDKG